jgi:RNA polymerase sigma-70 factor, ECF subfamily
MKVRGRNADHAFRGCFKYNCVSANKSAMENAGITQLLGEAKRGNSEAQSRLASAVYQELHRLAARCMYGERSDHSLQATILVHEAFIRLVAQDDRSWQNRAHFFGAAAQVMRCILIDYARNRRAVKRGSGQPKVPFDETIALSNDNCEEWIAVDQALNRLAERDARMARIVELRFFAGLKEEEIAEVLGISVRTVKRDWRVAKAWLHSELSGVKSDDSGSMAARQGHHR